MFLLLCFSLVVIACAWVGARTSKLPKTKVHLICAAICLLLIAGAVASRNLHLLPDALIRSEVGYLQYTWFTPLAALLFFVAAGDASTRRNSRLLKIFVLLLSVFSASRLLDQQGFFLG